jgi:hypothetical protein
MFHKRSEGQLQERIHLKKSMTLLPAVIGALGFPLEPHSESDLTTNIYFGSTLIANMHESDHRISFIRLKKSMTSLPAMIEVLGSPLGPHLESDLTTDQYFGSTPIANMDEFNYRINFNHLKKSATSLLAVIGALSFPLGPHPKSDLTTDLYFGSIPIANMDEFDRHIIFNRLKKSTTSFLVAIGRLSSPLGPHPESDIATNLYSSSIPVANMDKSDHRISFNHLNKFTILLLAAIGASGSPLEPRPERDLAIDLYSYPTPIAIKGEFNCWINFKQLQEI